MWYINTKWANAVENGADSLAQCRDGTKVQFVKKLQYLWNTIKWSSINLKGMPVY